MSLATKIYLTLNAFAVVYFAFMAGCRWQKRKDANRAIYETGGGDKRKAEILAAASLQESRDD